jgi:hypothetical protein
MTFQEAVARLVRAMQAEGIEPVDGRYVLHLPIQGVAKAHAPRSSYRMGAMTKRQARRLSTAWLYLP